MTTSPARIDSSHSDQWRFSRDGHVGSHASSPSQKDPVVIYTAELVARVALVCDGQRPTPLAAKLNLHPETVRRYLNGQRPSPEFLAAICREMNISPEWLLLGEGAMHRSRPG